MKKIATVIGSIVIASVVMAAAARLVYRADLVGDGVGKAVYKVTTDNTRQPELQVEGEDMAPDTDVVVKTAGLQFPVTTDEFGTFNIDVRFRNSNAPKIVEGTVVKVLYMDGTIALRGRFSKQ